MSDILNVYSEIGRLKKVMLHRPGNEIENLTPDLMDRLLFDDIPYLKVAREEHDFFAKTLRENGVEVVYLEDLVAEAIEDEKVKEKFVDEFIAETSIESHRLRELVKKYLLEFKSNKAMVDKMMEGIRKEDIQTYERVHLSDMVGTLYPFVVDPMPNLYFTRDPFSTIGSGISLNHMRTVTRNRETLFSKYVFSYHPDYKNENIPFWYDRDDTTSIEGGDQLVLSKKVLAIGISERTDASSVEKIAKRIF